MARMAIKRQVPTPEDAFSDMFGSIAEAKDRGDIAEIEISDLIPYKTPEGKPQPFKMYTEEAIMQLAENIKQNGILQPVLIRPHKQYKNEFEIIAGHNRTEGAKLAGLTTIPCLIKEFDDDEAMAIMLDTNLNQRQELSFSELAFAYKLRLEVENRQGQRIDLTSRHHVAKFTLAEKRKAQRYARLTYLNPYLLKLVDKKELSMGSGISLSYLEDESQKILIQYLQDNKNTHINAQIAEDLRAMDGKTFSLNTLNDYFHPNKRQSAKPKSIKINFDTIKDYVDIEREDLENYIIKAIIQYQEKNMNNFAT